MLKVLMFCLGFAGIALASVIAFGESKHFLTDDDDSKTLARSSDPPAMPLSPAPESTDPRQLVLEDAREEKFTGEINGFTFVPSNDPYTEWRPEKCRTEASPETSGEASPSEIAGSPLDFHPRYLPAGHHLSFEDASKCQGEVTTVVRNYRSRTNGQSVIVITRTSAPPVWLGLTPEDRLTPATIAGRPAVVMEPLAQSNSSVTQTAVLMKGAPGYWYVSGTAMDRDEVIKVAENITTR